jgi:hypothetical protein
MALSALAFSDLKVDSARAASFLSRLECSYALLVSIYIGMSRRIKYLHICASFEDGIPENHGDVGRGERQMIDR